MSQLCVITRTGERITIEAAEGVSVMEAIRDSGEVDELMALCGGGCACATCHVYIDGDFVRRLPPIAADEDELLSGVVARQSSSRLGCQIRLNESLSGLCVTVAPAE
jgi:2Fe-2S ferredoxin